MLLLLPKNLRWSHIWPSYPWTKKIQRVFEIKGHAVFSTNKLSTCSQVATFAMGWFWGPQARLIPESWAVATPIRSHLSQTFQAQFDKVPGVLKTLRSEIFRVGFRLILCKSCWVSGTSWKCWVRALMRFLMLMECYWFPKDRWIHWG